MSTLSRNACLDCKDNSNRRSIDVNGSRIRVNWISTWSICIWLGPRHDLKKFQLRYSCHSESNGSGLRWLNQTPFRDKETASCWATCLTHLSHRKDDKEHQISIAVVGGNRCSCPIENLHIHCNIHFILLSLLIRHILFQWGGYIFQPRCYK